MRKIFFVIIISFQVSFSQQMKRNNIHPFSGSFVFTLRGGETFLASDYSNFSPDFQLQGSAEYFLNLKSRSTIGLRVLGSQGILSGSDPLIVPDKFNTSFTMLGGGIVYSYYFSSGFMPYLFGGISNLWYTPKDANGVQLPYANGNVGSLTELIYNAEIGFHSYLTKDFILNASFGFNTGQYDLLDGFNVQGSKSDYFFTGSIGVSFALSSNEENETDTDFDGVPDNIDKCEGTPYGIDVTIDGCPKDSDADGVPDYLDKCPGTQIGISVDSNGCKINGEKQKPEINKNIEAEKSQVNKKTTKHPFHVYSLAKENEIEKNIWSDGTQFVIQLSSWSTEVKAEKVVSKLKEKGINAFVQKAFVNKFNRTFYRVRIGYFNTLSEARSVSRSLK